MDENNIYKLVNKKFKQGADDATLRALLGRAGLTVYDADQYILRAKTKASFFTVRWPVILLGCYFWAGLLYAGLHYAGRYTELSIQTQAVNLATLALALFIVGLLFRPKPQGHGARNIYTTLELSFAGALVALTLVLLQHQGWASPKLPDGGAFASSVWPLLWLGAWLGPQVLAVATLVMGHYAVLNIRTSYFLNRQSLLLEQRRIALREHYQATLEQSEFVPAEQATNLAQKLVKLLLTNSSWNPKSTIEIYSLGKQIQVRPLGGGGAVLTATDISPPPAMLNDDHTNGSEQELSELEIATLELAGYER